MLKILGAYDNEMIAQFIKMKVVWKEFTNVKYEYRLKFLLPVFLSIKNSDRIV